MSLTNSPWDCNEIRTEQHGASSSGRPSSIERLPVAHHALATQQGLETGQRAQHLHFIDGLYPYPLPAVLGHEAAGVVEAVGEDVTSKIMIFFY